MDPLRDYLRDAFRSAFPGLYKRRIRHAAFTKRDPRFEPEVHLVRRLVKPRRAFLDIGANSGTYGILVEDLAGALNVYSIEPVDTAFRELRKLRTARRTYRLALSSEEGTAPLRIPIVNGTPISTRASLEPDVVEKNQTGMDIQTVPMTTLDRFVEREVRGPIGFLKIDVEGHEDRVLMGGAGTLAMHRPCLLVEMEQRHHRNPLSSHFARVEAHGYRGYFLDPEERELRSVSQFRPERDQPAPAASRWINNFFFFPDGDSEDLLQAVESMAQESAPALTGAHGESDIASRLT